MEGYTPDLFRVCARVFVSERSQPDKHAEERTTPRPKGTLPDRIATALVCLTGSVETCRRDSPLSLAGDKKAATWA